MVIRGPTSLQISGLKLIPTRSEIPRQRDAVLAPAAAVRAVARRDDGEVFRAHDRADAVRASVEVGVVMLHVNEAARAVADGAADQNVGEEVWAARVARQPHRGGEAVSPEAHQPAGAPVLVRDDGRERPRAARMARREGRAAVKEFAARVVLRGARAPERPLGDPDDYP